MSQTLNKTSRALLYVTALACFAVFLFIATLGQPRETQIASDTALLLVLIGASFIRRGQSDWINRFIRSLLIFATIFLWFRYLSWRGSETLPLQYGVTAMVCGTLFFLIECYCFLSSSLSNIAILNPLKRTSLALPPDQGLLPNVDVIITTFDEHPNILRPTVIAATQMHYPAHKLRVYILDDGGTAQKCHDPDKEKSEAAQQRATEIKAIAVQFGAHYRTREVNEYAKAGNVNHGLSVSNGELVVILDCDHVPTGDFVEKTVGFFLADPKLFLVQTQHHFINPDPLERNLASFDVSPAENELFYGEIQPGLDAWGASFFCGSAAVLRRSVLDEIGGLARQTVTEDVETTIAAMSRGYTTAYLNRALISALQPESFSGFIRQRTRWSQGMAQIFLLKNPWLQPGLSFMQRVFYTNVVMVWGLPFCRLLMLLTPPAVLLFSIRIIDASVANILMFGAPPMIASLMASQYLYGRVRWPFISQLYEVIQSLHLTAGIFKVLRRPRSPSFIVTPKGEVMKENFISSLARPFYLLLLINLAALINGVLRYIDASTKQDVLLLVGAWALLDLVFLMCVLGITFERRQRRTEPRTPIDEPVRLHLAQGLHLDGMATQASASGVRITLHCSENQYARLQLPKTLQLEFPQRGISLASALRETTMANAQVTLGLTYRFRSTEDERAAIALAFGSSEQLQKNSARRHQGKSVLMSLLNLFGFAGKHGLGHLAFLVSSFRTRTGLTLQAPTLEEK